MPALIDRSVRKSASDTAAEERVRRAKAGHASFAQAFASLATTKAETAPKPTAFLSGIGGASNLPEAKASTVARKSELDVLPAEVARVAHRVSPEGAKLLAAIVKRSAAENGAPITFESADVTTITGLPREKAQALTESLIRADLLRMRTTPSGGPAGYSPNLPKA